MPPRRVYTYGIGADEYLPVMIPIVTLTWRCDRCTDGIPGNGDEAQGRLHANA